jgi:transcriptional regulator with PAS, ATPase and Fis domain
MFPEVLKAFRFDIIFGQFAVVVKLEQVRRIADSSATVLILGESGTGKELFAICPLSQNQESSAVIFLSHQRVPY